MTEPPQELLSFRARRPARFREFLAICQTLPNKFDMPVAHVLESRRKPFDLVFVQVNPFRELPSHSAQ